MKLNLVESDEELINPGDAILVLGINSVTKERIPQLIICCPKCGKKSASRGNHIFTESTKSYYPSIVHDKAYGGCGWHGWLTNGEFKEI